MVVSTQFTNMKQEESNITGYHLILFIICFAGTAFAGMISTLMSVYLPEVVTEISSESLLTDNISAYINAVFIIGAAAGGFVCGFVSDLQGRKAGLILSIFSYSLFTLLTGFMNSWSMIAICRFFSGFGMGGILVTGTTILMESWPKKSRAIFVGFLSISIPVGIFSAGLINYFVSSWRQAFLVGVIPLCITVLAFWLVRESELWKQNRQTASFISRKENIFNHAYRKNLLAGSIMFGTMLIGLWAIFSWLPTWLQTLVTSGDGHQERGLSMMMLGGGGLLGGFISGWFTNTLGARKSMMLCFLVCAIVTVVLLKGNTSITFLVYVEIAVLAIFFGLSQGVLSVLIPSLFPVGVRGAATGFCFNIGRIFTAIAVLFIGVLVTTLGGYANSLIVFSMVFVVGLVVTFFSAEKTAFADLEVAALPTEGSSTPDGAPLTPDPDKKIVIGSNLH
jgi:MFS family permease